MTMPVGGSGSGSPTPIPNGGGTTPPPAQEIPFTPIDTLGSDYTLLDFRGQDGFTANFPVLSQVNNAVQLASIELQEVITLNNILTPQAQVQLNYALTNQALGAASVFVLMEVQQAEALALISQENQQINTMNQQITLLESEEGTDVGETNTMNAATDAYINNVNAINGDIAGQQSELSGFQAQLTLDQAALQNAESTGDPTLINQAQSAVNVDQINITNANSAIASLRSELGTQETIYNTAVNTYNSYVAGRNLVIAAYNTAAQNYSNTVTQYTQLVANLNAERGADAVPLPDLPPAPDPSTVPPQVLPMPTAPLAPPIPTQMDPLPPRILVEVPPIIAVPAIPTVNGALLLYFSPVLFFMAQAFQGITSRMSVLNNFIDLRQLLLLGHPINLPDSYYIQYPDPSSLEGGSAAGGPSVGFGLLSDITQLQFLASALSRSLLIAALQGSGVPDPGNIANILTLTVQQLIFQKGVFAVGPALQLFEQQIAALGPDSPLASTVLSLAFLNSVQGLIGSGSIQEALTSIPEIQELEYTNPVAFGALADQIATITNFSLLGIGLAQAIVTLNLPGLGPQLIANISGLTDAQAVLAIFGGSNLQAILSNPFSLIAVNATVTSVLVNEYGYSSEAALAIGSTLDSIIGNIGPYVSELDVRNAIATQLVATGVDPATARQVANLTVDNLAAETPYLNLESPFDPQNTGNNGFIVQSLVDSLIGRGYDASLANILVNNALIRTLGVSDTYQTDRQYRNSLAESFQLQGISRPDSFALANLATGILQGSQFSTIQSALLNQDILIASLNVQLDKNEVNNPLAIATNVAAQVLGIIAYEDEGLLRSSIQSALIQEGVSAPIAADVAQSAVVQLNLIDAGVSPLLAFGLGTPLDPVALAEELSTQISNQLAPSVGATTANLIGNTFAANLIGGAFENDAVIAELLNPVSVLSSLGQTLQKFKEVIRSDKDFLLDQQFRQFMLPEEQLYAFLDAMLDPANNILYSGATSPVYSHTPENIQQTPGTSIAV